MQENNSDCSRMTQHALVVGFSDHVQSDPTVLALPPQAAHSAIQSDFTQESVKPNSACLAPRASATNEQSLRYYLDRTSDLRQNKELIFVSFKVFTRTSHLPPFLHRSSRL